MDRALLQLHLRAVSQNPEDWKYLDTLTITDPHIPAEKAIWQHYRNRTRFNPSVFLFLPYRVTWVADDTGPVRLVIIDRRPLVAACDGIQRGFMGGVDVL